MSSALLIFAQRYAGSATRGRRSQYPSRQGLHWGRRSGVSIDPSQRPARLREGRSSHEHPHHRPGEMEARRHTVPTTTQPMMERRAFLRVAARGAVAALAGLAFSRVASPRPTGQAPAPTHDLATPNLRAGRVLVAYFSRAGENYFDGRQDVPRGREYRGRRRPDRFAFLACDVYRIEAADPYPDSYDDTVAPKRRRSKRRTPVRRSPTHSTRSISTTRSCSAARSGTSALR